MSKESVRVKQSRILRLRSEINQRRPKFLRENYYRLKRIQTSWRSPKGIDSKMRERRAGKRKIPQTGYRGPKLTRDLHPSGFEITQVFNVDDLEEINTDNQIVQIGGSVGSRKRMKIIDVAEEKGIHVINPQIARLAFEDEEFIEELEDEYELLDDDPDDAENEDFELLDDDPEDVENDDIELSDGNEIEGEDL